MLFFKVVCVKWSPHKIREHLHYMQEWSTGAQSSSSIYMLESQKTLSRATL